MSEWNRKGEECDCGSTTEHKRSPGCTSPAEALIYERGGYMAWCAEHGSECARDQSNCRPGPQPKCSRCGGHCTSDATCRPTPKHEGPCAHGVPCSTPAALLGEARAHLRRAIELLEKAGANDSADRARDIANQTEVREARRPPTHPPCPRHGAWCSFNHPAVCWQCDAPLGNTEACLTCAAKRREDTAPEVG